MLGTIYNYFPYYTVVYNDVIKWQEKEIELGIHVCVCMPAMAVQLPTFKRVVRLLLVLLLLLR